MKDDEFMKLLSESDNSTAKPKKAPAKAAKKSTGVKKKDQPSSDALLDAISSKNFQTTEILGDKQNDVNNNDIQSELEEKTDNTKADSFSISDEQKIQVNPNNLFSNPFDQISQFSSSHNQPMFNDTLPIDDQASNSDEHLNNKEEDFQGYESEHLEDSNPPITKYDLNDSSINNSLSEAEQQAQEAIEPKSAIDNKPLTAPIKKHELSLETGINDGSGAGSPGDSSFSSVAQSTNTKRLITILLIIFAISSFYYLFTKINYNPNREKIAKEKAIEDKKQELLDTAKSVAPAAPVSQQGLSEDAPKAPAPMPIAPPTPPAPPPPPTPVAPPPPVLPQVTTTGPTLPIAPSFMAPKGNSPIPNASVSHSIFGDDEAAEKAKLLARRKSSSIITGGGGEASNKTSSTQSNAQSGTSASGENSFLGFSNGALSGPKLQYTQSAQVSASYIGKLDTMIAQGKMLNAVLETAINTDLPGSLRAVITRDVYAESGKNILIPKGSRVIGVYQSSLSAGQVRVGVVWNRLIRPDGIDIQMGFAGTDELGRSGVAGYLDNKFWLQMGLAVLTSYIIPVAAARISNTNDNSIVNSATQNSDGSVTTSTTGNVGSSQLQQGAQSFQGIAQNAINNSFNTNSTIIVDQGARVNIFVNKDLVFPDEVVNNSMQVLR